MLRHKSDITILGMCLILALLIARLFWTGGSATSAGDFAAATKSEEKQVVSTSEYVSSYPDLYAEPLVDFSEPASGKKIAFLTFDDGPSENTDQLLKILKEENVKATFFIVGVKITKDNIDCLQRMIDDGHTIGLHSYTHDYGKIYASVDAFLEDYEKLYRRIYDAVGIKPNTYRFPGGSYSNYNKRIRNEIIAEMERRGFTYYDWNVSAQDAVGSPSGASIMENIRKDVFKFQCPVILMHDSGKNDLTVKQLSKIISEIRNAGYEFGTLESREPCHFNF